MTNNERQALIEGMNRVCSRATEEKCSHEKAGRRNERITDILNGVIFVLTLLTSSALFGSLSEGFPNEAKLLGASLGLIAAIFAAFLALYRFPEKASRHNELSICYDVIANSCAISTDRFNAGQMGVKEFDVRLRTYNEAVNQIVARANQLTVRERDWQKCAGEMAAAT